jgi:hypothetical protein
MSQRDSGYERIERDEYTTPAWVTAALSPHLHLAHHVWEPACGSGVMANAHRSAGYNVHETDIETGTDFLKADGLPNLVQCVCTNPPYTLAREFIEHSLQLTKPVGGVVAMLLRTDYDHAVSRRHLFAECQAFAKKLVLTKRIKWFADTKGQPSFNHAWFIWEWTHAGRPTIAYAPDQKP